MGGEVHILVPPEEAGEVPGLALTAIASLPQLADEVRRQVIVERARGAGDL